MSNYVGAMITASEGDSSEYEYPSYSDPGRVLVHMIGPIGAGFMECEVDVLDYDADSSVMWLNEGQGIDYWVHECDFAEPGYYVIEGITGTYYRGDGYSTDDDEEWEYERIRPATDAEISGGCLIGDAR